MHQELTISPRRPWVWGVAALLLAVPALFAQQPVIVITPGFMAWVATGSCPSGWSTYAAAQGRVVVGVPSGGTLAGTQGTALSAQENRSIGAHTHSTTETPHGHSVTDPGHVHGGMVQSVTLGSGDPINGANSINGFGGNTQTVASGITVQAAAAGVTISNQGSVVGTNAPYIELLPCTKN